MRRVGSVALLLVLISGAFGSALQGTPAAQARTTAITIDVLNLRAEPSLSAAVLTAMPREASVILAGGERNGFRAVTYNGISGWAFGTYLAIDAAPPAPNRSATTTDALNLRAGAATSYPVLVVMPAGATVTATGKQANGFLSVTFNGYSGWAHRDYLRLSSSAAPDALASPGIGDTAVTTDALNLRRGAGTSHAVITVMPAGTRVVLTGRTANGFHAVSFDGRSGWAASRFLAVDGTLPAPRGAATVTDDLNLRSGPATSYPVLAAMPRGARVTLTGQVNNGFHSVSYNGRTGWAFSSYLDLPPAPPAPPADFAATNAIIGPARGTPEEAIAFARRAGARRMPEVERYIREIYLRAPQVGFDPAILISQSALETGYWTSDWWVLRLNPAGIDITGSPRQETGSPRYPNGMVAARAQLAHMHAEVYGSSRPLPPVLQGVDPTYQRVFDAGWAGTVRTIEDLSGTWAVDRAYHEKIVRVAREIYKD